jgi:hypothetical protein
MHVKENNEPKKKNTMSLLIAKNKVSAEQLLTVATPAATESFQPIGHALLVDQMREAIARAGFSIKEEEHALARMGQRYFGGFSIVGKDVNATDRELVLGLRNAHDKSFAASICIGNRMLVCENLCFSSDIKLARKHTTNILRDIARVLSEAVGRCVSHFSDMTNRIDNYKTIELVEDEAAGLIMSLADAKAIPAREVYPIMQQFRTPNHPEFNGKTLWSLYNGVTECLKGGDLSKLPARTMTMQSIFDARAGHNSVIQAEIDKSELMMEA